MILGGEQLSTEWVLMNFSLIKEPPPDGLILCNFTLGKKVIIKQLQKQIAPLTLFRKDIVPSETIKLILNYFWRHICEPCNESTTFDKEKLLLNVFFFSLKIIKIKYTENVKVLKILFDAVFFINLKDIKKFACIFYAFINI